jgi:hypothetical protein
MLAWTARKCADDVVVRETPDRPSMGLACAEAETFGGQMKRDNDI